MPAAAASKRNQTASRLRDACRLGAPDEASRPSGWLAPGIQYCARRGPRFGVGDQGDSEPEIWSALLPEGTARVPGRPRAAGVSPTLARREWRRGGL